MSVSLSELRRVFETATANVDKVSFTITAVPAPPEDLMAMLTLAHAAGHHSARRCGASSCRRERRNPSAGPFTRLW
jgi:hypothetical protein